MTGKTVVITGAAGFVGSELCSRFAENGWNVRAGVRRPQLFSRRDERVSPFQCDLPFLLEVDAFRQADVLIHAAYSMRACDQEKARETNFEGTEAVLEAAREAGVRKRVFISSCSAHDAALSFYGRSKFALEKRFEGSRDLILRPGLVLGDGGLFERMKESLQKSALVPLFDGGHQVLQTVHIDDLTEAVLRAIEGKKTGRLVIAETGGIEMRLFLEVMARLLRLKRRFLSVPTAPSLPILRLAEKLGTRLPVGSENLLGLRGMIHQPSRETQQLLDLRFRPARESLRQLLA